MKKEFITGTIIGLSLLCFSPSQVQASETINQTIGSVGIGAILEQEKTEEEYMEAIQGVTLYGYNNIGIANVEGIDSQSHVFNFNIEENSFDPTFMSYSSNRPGLIFTCLSWETEKIG